MTPAAVLLYAQLELSKEYIERAVRGRMTLCDGPAGSEFTVTLEYSGGQRIKHFKREYVGVDRLLRRPCSYIDDLILEALG